MLFYVHLTERRPADPQEARAMALIRARSLQWLQAQGDRGAWEFGFRNSENTATHLFLEASSAIELHRKVDPDPLLSYSTVCIEPLLRTQEMAAELQSYLQTELLTDRELASLSFPKVALDPNGTYFLAVKMVAPFSPLLSLEDQNRIHMNTLIAQKAHEDGREIADYNPVGRPVGILVMRADDEDEVREHVMDCAVFVDTMVTFTRLLTFEQAAARNDLDLARYMVGQFAPRELGRGGL